MGGSPPHLHNSLPYYTLLPSSAPYVPRSLLTLLVSGKKQGRPGRSPGHLRDPKSGPAAGPEEQWSGKLVKRFFSPAYSSISAGLAQDRQEDKQTIRKVLIRRLSFSHFPTVSDLDTQTRVNSDPSEPSVGLFIKMMRLAWQLGWWTHICTALFTPQRRQLKHRAKRSSRSNAFVVIGSNIEMPSWK